MDEKSEKSEKNEKNEIGGNDETNGRNETDGKSGVFAETVEGAAETGEEKSPEKPPFFGRKGVKRAFCAAGAAAVVTGAFFGGFFTYKATLPKEINSLLWAKERIQSDYYEEISDEEFFSAVFFGVNSLLDDYSWYMTEEDYVRAQKQSAGEYSGTGLYFSVRKEGATERLTVARVAGGSPAEEAGIREGSRVTGFGMNETEMTEIETFAAFYAFVSALGTGEEFYLTELCYPYGADDARVVKVRKADFVENYVFYRTNASSYVYLGEEATETEKGAPLAALPNDAAYIRLTQFNGNAAKEFDAAMARFKADGKKRLVLDLRENGGGDLDILRSIASYFCKDAEKSKPVVAKAVDREGKTYAFNATGNLYGEYFGANGKAYVLADANTASASECLLGCMLDYGCIDYDNICLSYRDGAAKTYGKGIMQTTATRYLWTSEAIKLTTAKICWPLSGTCIHGTGITAEDGTRTTEENYAADGEISAALAALL